MNTDLDHWFCLTALDDLANQSEWVFFFFLDVSFVSEVNKIALATIFIFPLFS